MDFIKTLLKNHKEKTIYPQTSLDQVIDKRTGKPLDTSYYELHEKTILAYENSKNNKVYTSMEDIGIEYGNETIKDIAYNLPANSTLIFHKKGAHVSPEVYPGRAGILTVEKADNATRVSFKFESSVMYQVGFFDFLNTSDPNNTEAMWSGWTNLLSLKSFTTFEEIGLTGGSETIKDIVEKIPLNSILQTLIISSYGNREIYPTNAGILTVKKSSHNGRVFFMFENELGGYFGYYNSYYDNNPKYNSWSGWRSYGSTIESFEEMGIIEGSETIEEIVSKLPIQTTLQLNILSNYGNSEIYPSHSGLLTVKKYQHSGRVSFLFEREDGYYVGYYNNSYEEGERWSGWKNLMGV